MGSTLTATLTAGLNKPKTLNDYSCTDLVTATVSTRDGKPQTRVRYPKNVTQNGSQNLDL